MVRSDPGASGGALQGVRILDLSRILAGPSATQIMGDLGADVIKIEHPQRGDDTRKWGPPFVRDDMGNETTESSYYTSANRNKKSVAVDIATPEGADIVRKIAAMSDVFIENFKVGGLAKYGLDHETLRAEFPHLIYCSITGFGQTGPYAPRAGYDFLIQAMGGLMSITGEPDGQPMKAGVAVSDLMAGMYALSSILAALYKRDADAGTDAKVQRRGQHIDISLLDTQIAWLSNVGMHALISGERPARLGNAHASIVPYRVFEVADGHVIIAAGNDRQFAAWCDAADCPHLKNDERFHTNEGRVRLRGELEAQMEDIMRARSQADWIAAMEKAGVPCGPVNAIDQVFEDPQVQARGMQFEMPHAVAAGGMIPQIASPVRMSGTPPTYRHGPPILGEHTSDVLSEILSLDETMQSELRNKGIIG